MIEYIFELHIHKMHHFKWKQFLCQRLFNAFLFKMYIFLTMLHASLTLQHYIIATFATNYRNAFGCYNFLYWKFQYNFITSFARNIAKLLYVWELLWKFTTVFYSLFNCVLDFLCAHAHTHRTCWDANHPFKVEQTTHYQANKYKMHKYSTVF